MEMNVDGKLVFGYKSRVVSKEIFLSDDEKTALFQIYVKTESARLHLEQYSIYQMQSLSMFV